VRMPAARAVTVHASDVPAAGAVVADVVVML
jgi:hypothetical protein